MQDCIDHCSRFWGNREGCYGVVWVETNNNCWLRNSTVSTTNLKVEEGCNSAIISEGQMNGYDTKCPYPDASIQTLSGVDSLGYTVNCNKVISGFDECFSGVPKPCTQPYFGFHHTESLEQCLRICVDSHPLCKAVSWSPDLKIGFANCWLKTGFPTDGLPSPPNNAGVLHSATVTRIDPVDRTCPSDKSYVSAQGNKKFDINCGQVNTGTNITSMHVQNLTSCMDACAQSNQNCIGVVFDSTLQGGFENCYLQNTTSTMSEQASATYAALNGSGAPASSSTSSADSSSSTLNSVKSKAWIAGPVLGGIAALLLLALLTLYLKKRKAKKAALAPHEKDESSETGYALGSAPAYSPGAGGYHDVDDGLPRELASDRTPREIGETGSTKYAQTHKEKTMAGATELP